MQASLVTTTSASGKTKYFSVQFADGDVIKMPSKRAALSLINKLNNSTVTQNDWTIDDSLQCLESNDYSRQPAESYIATNQNNQGFAPIPKDEFDGTGRGLQDTGLQYNDAERRKIQYEFVSGRVEDTCNRIDRENSESRKQQGESRKSQSESRKRQSESVQRIAESRKRVAELEEFKQALLKLPTNFTPDAADRPRYDRDTRTQNQIPHGLDDQGDCIDITATTMELDW